ncbi:MAG: hypothetical protein HFG20_08370 [Anaerotruncus sp.]|jgi:rod shape-determining protein MreD|nr:hypothetical protein [Anaerotruncus sp.]
MTNKRGVYVAKYTAYFFVLVCLYVLQTTPSFMAVFGIKPNLVIPAAICIAMLEGEFTGGLYGALAGALCDLGDFCIFGFNAIILLIACVLAGLMVIYMLRATVLNFVLLAFGALLARTLLDYLLNYYMWGYEGVWMVLVYKMLPTVIYSAAAAPVSYYLLCWLHGWFAVRLES